MTDEQRSPRWSAVVVNYESGTALSECVESLLADSSAGGPPDVVVVDNGSRRRIDRDVAEPLPGGARGRSGRERRIRRWHEPRHRGDDHARRRSVQSRSARSPRGPARPCSRGSTIPGVAAAGPRIRNPDGSTYPSARSVPSHVDAVGHGLLGLLWPANPFSTRYRQLDADPDVARDVDWVSGAAIWLRRDALDAIGGWDDGYFMYVEDVDLCWRLGRAGWRIVYEPGGEVVHAQGLSTDAKPYRMIVEHHRSLLRFASKRWRGPRRLLLGPAAVYLAFRSALAMAVRAFRPRSGKPRVRG